MYPNYNVPCTLIYHINTDVECKKYEEDYIPKEIIFQTDKKTTILVWDDDSRTIVRCSENEEFVPEFGVAMATMKKIYGDRGTFLHHMEMVGKEQKQYVKKLKNNEK